MDKSPCGGSNPCMGLGLSSGIFEPAPLSFGPVRSVVDSIEPCASIAQKGTTTRVIRVAPVAQLSGSSPINAARTKQSDARLPWRGDHTATAVYSLWAARQDISIILPL